MSTSAYTTQTMTIYRVQDEEGRGPFKPNFTQKWSEDRPDLDNLTSILHDWTDIRAKLIKGYHAGCGCRTLDQLRRWFTPTEYQRLVELGYKAVAISPGIIVFDNEVQTVFQRKLPLHHNAEAIDLYP